MIMIRFTTKTDLNRFVALMIMGLFGIVFAMMNNIFLKSSVIDYIISFIGMLVFTGFQVYDVQKQKQIGHMKYEADSFRGRINGYINPLS